MSDHNAKARLDADRTAKPLTRIVGHAKANHVQGPMITIPDTYVCGDKRIPLKASTTINRPYSFRHKYRIDDLASTAIEGPWVVDGPTLLGVTVEDRTEAAILMKRLNDAFEAGQEQGL